MLTVQLTSIGLPVVNTKRAANGDTKCISLISTVIQIPLIVFGIVLFSVFFEGLGSRSLSYHQIWYVSLIAINSAILQNYNATWAGLEDFLSIIKFDMIQKTALLVCSLVLIYINVATPDVLFILVISILTVQNIFLAREWVVKTKIKDIQNYLKDFSYGFKSYISSCLYLINSRVLYIVAIANTDQNFAGILSLALTLFDFIYLVPLSITQVLFPKMLRNDLQLFKVLKLYGFFIFSLSGLGYYILVSNGENIISFIFGKEYNAVVPILLALTPSFIALSFINFLMTFLASNGMPLSVTMIPLTGTIVIVILYRLIEINSYTMLFFCGNAASLICGIIAMMMARRNYYEKKL